ncbi:MAG: outer membrane beta-barrel protein [Ekhidna sp.]|uniref:outer membrane beta-barrel protein n=1 Tax=Ekhidna sp. TaxID=2608089 RepID=UPI0032F0821F
MKFIFSTILTLLFAFSSHGQYWFGPKVGISYIDHVYQDRTYEKDSFDVKQDLNFQAGIAFNYTASDMYSVYAELLYEKVDKTVKDKSSGGELVNASMTNHFLSAPVMLRVTLGKVPFHYYVNAGPRLSYWLGGKGSLFLDEFNENPPIMDDDGNPLPVEYKTTFNSDKALDGDRGTALVSKPNRLQFGLTAGGGMYFDLANGTRLQVDLRYTWVHSNMGTNNGVQDINFAGENYRENFEYYHNIATIGIAYLFNYDANLKRKGSSTSKESKKRKK